MVVVIVVVVVVVVVVGGGGRRRRFGVPIKWCFLIFFRGLTHNSLHNIFRLHWPSTSALAFACVRDSFDWWCHPSFSLGTTAESG